MNGASACGSAGQESGGGTVGMAGLAYGGAVAGGFASRPLLAPKVAVETRTDASACTARSDATELLDPTRSTVALSVSGTSSATERRKAVDSDRGTQGAPTAALMVSRPSPARYPVWVLPQDSHEGGMAIVLLTPSAARRQVSAAP